MRFGSVCSGIEAASVAWTPLGWKAAWLAEIEPFPSAVLAHHYPDVPNLGDMTCLPTRKSFASRYMTGGGLIVTETMRPIGYGDGYGHGYGHGAISLATRRRRP